MSDAKVRLCVDQPLGKGQSVLLARDQAHYLFGVMRLRAGDPVLLFNGRDGEWQAEVAEIGKRDGTLTCTEQTKGQDAPPDLWLLFAPIKKARTDFIVEKAVEMGAARILPVQTEFTSSERIRRDRLQAHATEAAEQCGIAYVPEVGELVKLDRVLENWPEGRTLWFCDETLAISGESSANRQRSEPCADESGASAPESAILIGPEGGFSETERARLASLSFVRGMALGPRILRADTAAVAALALWQTKTGDWR